MPFMFKLAQRWSRFRSAVVATALVVGACESRALTSEGTELLPPPPGGLPVIPGIQGHGTTTPAGRGGAVLRVTNLNDAGAGSLRAAIDATGPRVVIFEVSGTIQLGSYLVIRSPFITVAGQTAPSPGITLRGAGITINTHDVLVRHIRIRPGDGASGPSSGNRDAMQILNATTHNIVVDHVSTSWAIDETMSTYYGPYNVTISNTIIAEGLSNSTHPEGEHSKGLLIGQSGYNTTIMRNLLAHNMDRNPYFKGDTYTMFINNIAYNYGNDYAVENGDGSHYGPQESTNIGNLYIPGASTPVNRDPIRVHSTTKPGSLIFVADNTFRREPPPVDPWQLVEFQPSDQSIKATRPPEWVTPLTVLPSSLVEQTVLATVGARPADRDAVDIRIINDVRNGTGRIINSQNEVGGWPLLAQNYRALTLPANPSGDDDGDGYTNLEEWLLLFAAQVEGR